MSSGFPDTFRPNTPVNGFDGFEHPSAQTFQYYTNESPSRENNDCCPASCPDKITQCPEEVQEWYNDLTPEQKNNCKRGGIFAALCVTCPPAAACYIAYLAEKSSQGHQQQNVYPHGGTPGGYPPNVYSEPSTANMW